MKGLSKFRIKTLRDIKERPGLGHSDNITDWSPFHLTGAQRQACQFLANNGLVTMHLSVTGNEYVVLTVKGFKILEEL